MHKPNKMKQIIRILFLALVLVSGLHSCKNQEEPKTGENTVSGTDRELVVNMEDTGIKIQPTMYGIFFEDINFAADGGLYAEMIKNRSFEFTLPKTGWMEPNSDRHSYNNDSGILTVIKYSEEDANHNFARVAVKNDEGYVLINEGFRGMGVKEGAQYDFSIKAAKRSGDIQKIKLQVIDSLDNVLGETSVTPDGDSWKTYESSFAVNKTEMKAKVKITFEGEGEIDLDMISLFPQDTWKGRKKGLRKDLVQLLDDMNPGFLRFPGGCIVEGRTLARRYQWKKTVGDIEDREILVNRWNTEFAHRPTPDYYQSFGLGFFEYFQLSEDMGAEPLPILGCGIACQFNTGELVPMDELGPYVQDALDLIEFANGDTNTAWGQVRADMGHPEPFNMKYIGIGNEQWGPAYIERYRVFEQAIKAKYPEIIIVSGSGPFPEGDYFEYGWEQLKQMNAEIVDEHYYKPPQWFRENADRYDSYDRNGPKVFAGEYAAQTVAIASPENKNNWNAALSEAAGWQWTPDMIWFNNLESFGTPNYQVQKMYATNAGTDLLKITEDGEKIIGEGGLYASAVKDANTNELIIKVVNTSEAGQNLSIAIEGGSAEGDVEVLTMAMDDLEAENSFEEPMKVSPKKGSATVNGNQLEATIPAQAFSIYKIKA